MDSSSRSQGEFCVSSGGTTRSDGSSSSKQDQSSKDTGRTRHIFKSSTQSYADLICRFLQNLGQSPLGVFTQAYFRHTNVLSTTTMSGSSAASEHRLFPAAVPFPTDVLPPRRRGQTRALFLRRAARHATNILFAYFTFVELGFPKSWRPVTFPPSGAKAVGAANLESEMLSFLRHDGGIGTTALAGGRAHFLKRLETLLA